MSIPSKPQQIAAVMRYLDSDRMEGKPLEEIAKEIVEGYLDALTNGMKVPTPPIREGMLLKSPVDGKVRRICWMSGDMVWVVADNSNYGWLGSADDQLWSYCEEFKPSTMKEVDGKRKRFEMTDKEIADAWSNQDWEVGDRLSQHQRQYQFEVIAVAPDCVLLQNTETLRLTSDSNSNLEKYYRREARKFQVAW